LDEFNKANELNICEINEGVKISKLKMSKTTLNSKYLKGHTVTSVYMISMVHIGLQH
jgi:hypothetical protein